MHGRKGEGRVHALVRRLTEERAEGASSHQPSSRAMNGVPRRRTGLTHASNPAQDEAAKANDEGRKGAPAHGLPWSHPKYPRHQARASQESLPMVGPQAQQALLLAMLLPRFSLHLPSFLNLFFVLSSSRSITLPSPPTSDCF